MNKLLLNCLLSESLSGALSSQIGHNYPSFSGPVSSLALHYGVDFAGDEAKHHLLSKRQRKKFNRVFHSKNPKTRRGKFVGDLSSLGGTFGGIRLADKLFKSKGHKIPQVLLGVAGHTLGRLIGNKFGRRIDKRVLRKKVR